MTVLEKIRAEIVETQKFAFLTKEEYDGLNMALKILDRYAEQDFCEKCEVGNPCLYCEHDFEPSDNDPYQTDMDEAWSIKDVADCFEKHGLIEQEPCEDAVSRQAVLDALDFYDGMNEQHFTVKNLREDMRELPSVQPKAKTGRWEMCKDDDGIYGVCDICGQDADFSHYGKAYDYCPNCGAKMVEPQESEDKE